MLLGETFGKRLKSSVVILSVAATSDPEYSSTVGGCGLGHLSPHLTVVATLNTLPPALKIGDETFFSSPCTVSVAGVGWMVYACLIGHDACSRRPTGRK